ncbi:DUF2071 domain-containing protein [Hydrotalea flava]|uniref:DUF2071 domain-containing protein n=1 Tax=Hydrotalea flava TaxID=714549 RepID=UPI0020A3452A|nr:DUF2071 domain-containing protein [Hydrotalea flava]
MRHTIQSNDKNLLIRYEWKVANEWNGIQVNADETPYWASPNSESRFITEHYYGFTKRAAQVTSAYQVMHPSWQIYPVQTYKIHCNAVALYRAAFKLVLSHKHRNLYFWPKVLQKKIFNRQLLRF